MPELKDPADASNFEEVGDPEDGENPLLETPSAGRKSGFQGTQLPFIGFSFNKHFTYGESGSVWFFLLWFLWFLFLFFIFIFIFYFYFLLLLYFFNFFFC